MTGAPTIPWLHAALAEAYGPQAAWWPAESPFAAISIKAPGLR